jgi:hypothetical protein
LSGDAAVGDIDSARGSRIATVQESIGAVMLRVLMIRSIAIRSEVQNMFDIYYGYGAVVLTV